MHKYLNVMHKYIYQFINVYIHSIQLIFYLFIFFKKIFIYLVFKNFNFFTQKIITLFSNLNKLINRIL